MGLIYESAIINLVVTCQVSLVKNPMPLFVRSVLITYTSNGIFSAFVILVWLNGSFGSLRCSPWARVHSSPQSVLEWSRHNIRRRGMADNKLDFAKLASLASNRATLPCPTLKSEIALIPAESSEPPKYFSRFSPP